MVSGQRSLKNLQMSGDKGISAFPDGEDMTKWLATIQGPEKTVRVVFICRY